MSSRLKRRSDVQGHTPFFQKEQQNQQQQAVITPGLEENFVDRVDEDVERKARQRIQKRQSIGKAGALLTPAAAASAAATPSSVREAAVAAPVIVEATPTRITNEQLTEHYTNCIKLSAENKISVKNAFKLQLIDYMAELLKKKEMDNFQAASCALDASAKIYAYRVDSVHTDTLKLAGGVGSVKEETGSKQTGGNDEYDGDVNDDDDPVKVVKKKRMRNTVEKNLKNINCSKFELEFDVDPLFKKTTAQYDSGGGGGGRYFLNTLMIRDDSCELIFDSSVLLTYSKNEDDDGKKVDDTEEPLELPLPDIPEECKICPTFESFTFRGWSLENDNLDASYSQISANNNDEHVFDINATVPPVETDGDNEVDDFAMDAEEGGGDIEEDMITNNDDEVSEARIAFKGNTVGTAALKLIDSDTLLSNLTSIPLEYSYFDTGRLGAWAGPKHWKFKQPVRISSSCSEDPKRKKQRKEDSILDFEELEDPTSLQLDSVHKLISVPKRTTKLQNKTIQSWNEDKRTLPEDLRYKGADLFKLEILDLVPLTTCQRQQQNSVDNVDDNVSDYDFDNRNDAENFCPDITRDPEDYSTSTQDPQQPQTVPFSEVISQVGDLVEAPNAVEKIMIGYAKQAKKMDMKRLKYLEWEILQTSSKDTEDKENADVNGGGSGDAMAGRMNFTDLYKKLKDSPRMPSKMKENLSVPLAFVAILHLCNENSLRLEGQEDLRDFTISQA